MSAPAETVLADGKRSPAPRRNWGQLSLGAYVRRRPMSKNTGARDEIATDGTTRGYRDTEKIAIEAASRLKTKQPNSAITVRDIESGKTTTIKYPHEFR